jgi:hypothetical protein
MQPNSRLSIRPAPAKNAYGGISAYVTAVVRVEESEGIRDILAHLTQLCNLYGPQNLIQEKPFLLIAACFYLDAAVKWNNGGKDKLMQLLRVILDACGIANGILDHYGWTELDNAINTIYKHHNPSRPQTGNPNSSTLLVNSISHDNNV